MKFISDVTLQQVLKKVPTKLVKAGQGENSHIHRLVGDPGADVILPVPVGISVYTQSGAKIGNKVYSFPYFNSLQYYSMLQET